MMPSARNLTPIIALIFAAAASAQPVLNTIIAPKGSTLGGDLVYLGGTFPAGTPTVTVDNVAGLVQFSSANYILFLTPAGQGVNKLVQVTINAQPSNSLQYSYDMPRINNVSAPSTGTAGGGTIQITGANFGSNPTVTIGGQLVVQSGPPTHSLFTGIIPAGQGANLPIVITAQGQTNLTTPTSFSYSSPMLSNVNPTQANTAGTSIITLTGSNFGQTPLVKVGSQTISPIPGTVTPTSLQFLMPAGAGTGIQVNVIVAGITSNPQLMTYAAPQITGISPLAGLTAGGNVIQVSGSNFGPASSASITFNNQTFAPAAGSGSHTSLHFILPPGEGLNRTLQVVAAGQFSNTNAQFSYAAPSISSITPDQVDPAGGGEFVIKGSNFGLNPVVLVNGNTAPITGRSHNHISCIAPAGTPGLATVTVSVQGQSDAEQMLTYICSGDFNADGSIDFFDYLDFVDAYSAGC